MRYVLPMRLMNNMRKIVIAVLIGAVVVLAAIFVTKFRATPASAINADYKSSAYEYKSDAALLPLQGSTYALIYSTRKGELACAVMDKGLLGYQLRSVSGFIDAAKTGEHLSSTFSRVFDNYTVTWGLETKGDIVGVTVGEVEAVMADYEDKTLWVACEKGVIRAGETVRIEA